uniref:Uncharacterized protein n=2 Tax=Steinernema glaseri TaxID=37863 RepID=A0A1I7ZQ42_9BILA
MDLGSSSVLLLQGHAEDSGPLSLQHAAIRAIALALFRANVRWRLLSEVTRSLKEWLADVDLPVKVKRLIYAGLRETFREVQRWGEKHMHMFPDDAARFTKNNVRRVHRGEHLRMFYDCIVWKANKYHIDDYATARKIALEECHNWPVMQFQFAAVYAMIDLLEQDTRFDKIRLRTFRKQIGDHCVYDFWIRVLEDREQWEKLFRPDGLSPHQLVSLVFQFAIVNGYFELMSFLWDRISSQQQEYIGFLNWKKVCFNAEHREVIRFLCTRLCSLNSVGLARITWTSFYDKVYHTLEDDSGNNVLKTESIRKLKCLLDNWCTSLRSAMLSKENFRAFTDSFVNNQPETFAMFLEYLDKNQLSSAREFVDRFYDKRKTSEEAKSLRQMVIRRQQTVD